MIPPTERRQLDLYIPARRDGSAFRSVAPWGDRAIESEPPPCACRVLRLLPRSDRDQRAPRVVDRIPEARVKFAAHPFVESLEFAAVEHSAQVSRRSRGLADLQKVGDGDVNGILDLLHGQFAQAGVV